MKIGELSRRTGVPASALRYYEQERLVPSAPRRSGQREYDDSHQTAVAVIQLAREAGFSIAEARQLIGEFGQNRWRRLAERKLAEARRTAERLSEMTRLLEKLLSCECPDLEFCGRVILRNRPDGRPVSPRARVSPSRRRP